MRGLEQIPWLYDSWSWVAERLGLASQRRRLLAGARGRLLEIGCGTGRNLGLARSAAFVVGIDPSVHVLNRARRRAPGVPLVRASAHALPFAPGVFDGVVSSLTFCSVPEPALGLAEVARVLAPSGELRMLEHVRAHSVWGARLQDVVAPLWTWATGGCHPNRETESAVERAGFQIDPVDREAHGVLRRFTARRRV
ncbi:MAG: class I SAM-dependent methyltransferase [Myxococcales bacterium]|nr:class I SAM-dependent methyltransferase [Myxococcales bacterium]